MKPSEKLLQNIGENITVALATLVFTGFMSLGDAFAVLVLAIGGGLVFFVYLAVKDARRGKFSIRRGFIE